MAVAAPRPRGVVDDTASPRSFAADRQANVRPDPDTDWASLAKPIDGAVEMTLGEFTDRAFTDKNRSLEDATVRLIGFVSPAESGSDAAFVLSRFSISCCAADARAMQVEIHETQAPRADSWVEITGNWKETTPSEDSLYDVPALAAKSLTPIRPPEVPYE